MGPMATDVAHGVSLCVSVGQSCEPCKNGSTDRAAVGMGTQGDPKNHVLDGGPIPLGEEAILFGGDGWCGFMLGLLQKFVAD